MELEFDKEMDAMLRRAGHSGVLVGNTAKLHLDADAINAFAENALPEKSRRIYTEHLAECDPCRKTLSSLILMNAEAEPAMAAAVPAQAALASIPWYRKLFSTPNLAYTFGGLILLFGGLIGFVAFQNMGSGTVAVSQLSETDTDRAVQKQSAPMAAAANSNAAANVSNTASNAVGEIPREVGSAGIPQDSDVPPLASPPPAPAPMISAPATGSSSAASGPVTTDAVTGGQPAPPKEVAKSADEGRMRVEDKRAISEQDARKLDLEINAARNQVNQNQQFPMPGPERGKDNVLQSRTMQRDNRANDDGPALKAKKAEAPAAGSRADSGSNRRTAGGKTFELKQGAWYDTTFRGQSTKNVRRGTDEYRKLDGGLRSIAESIGGLVVVVWNGKAYRIQ